MFKPILLLALLGCSITLGGCATPRPATPSVAAMPGKGKSYEAFRNEDAYCQTAARDAIGNQSPGEAANQAAVGSAVVGTAVGTLAGAALGSVSGNMGRGAAVGAGTGLIAGSAIGSGNGLAAGDSVQFRYDTVYTQCMTAKGNYLPYMGGPPPYPYPPRPY